VRTFALHVVVEEHLFRDGHMAYAAYVPKLKSLDATSWGHAREDALKNLQGATELVIESMIARGEPLPEGVRIS
jgi:predicted RNase H-like HicB family nuclease